METSTPVKRTAIERSPNSDNLENKKSKLEESYNSEDSTNTTSPNMEGEADTGTGSGSGKQSDFTKNLPKEGSSMDVWGEYLVRCLQETNEKVNNLVIENRELSDRLETAGNEKEKTTEAVIIIKNSVEKLILENRCLQSENKTLHERLLKLEYHQRRNNIQMDGIMEESNESTKDCYNKVMAELTKLFQDDVNEEGEIVKSAKVKAEEIVINRIHRNGRPIPGQSRPILFNLQWYGDKEYIMREKKKLRDGIYVNEDFPPEIQERRRILRPILKKGIRGNYKGKISLSYDKLIVNGKAYTASNLHELPVDLNPQETCQRSNDDTVAFFGLHSPLSNFHRSPMKIDNVNYFCVEQYFQAAKAEKFNDDDTHYKIMRSNNPFEVKQLSYKVKDFIQQQWDDCSMAIMKKGVLNKFCQNEGLIPHLVATGKKAIIEASRDRTWGCGISLTDPTLLNSQAWSNEGGRMKEVYQYVKSELHLAG